MKDSEGLAGLIDNLSPGQRGLIGRIIDRDGLLPRMMVAGARSLELAEADELVFCKTDTPPMIERLLATRSCCVVTNDEVVTRLPEEFLRERVLLVTPQPRRLLALLLRPFAERAGHGLDPAWRIHPAAVIDPTVRLAPGVVIGPRVEIGAGGEIGANTVIDNAVIGRGTRIGANCSIGGDGFGFEIDEETQEVLKIPHFGIVRIGNGVEIFANVCIARGSLADTVIEDAVRIDNLVHVAHNCLIRKNSFIIANTMLGGSAVVGAGAWIAPSTSILNGISIGDGAMTGMGSVVTKPVGEHDLVAGVPARRLRSRRE